MKPDVGAVRRYRKSQEALVQRLIERATANPAAFRRRVAFMRFSAYAYVVLIVLFLVGLLAGCVALLLHGRVHFLQIGVAVFSVGSLIAIGRALAIKPGAVPGYRLPQGVAPALQAEIRRFESTLDLTPIDEVIIDFRVNASLAVLPSGSIFGGTRSVLTLGYPLMAFLPKAEARTVLLHELGHYAGGHGHARLKSYAMSARIEGMQDNLLDRGRGAWMMEPLLGWLGPRLGAAMFALARVDEIEADQIAAKAEDPETLGIAVLRIEVVAKCFDLVLPTLIENNSVTPEILETVLERTRTMLGVEPVVRDFARQAFERKTGLQDEHLCIGDVFRNVGIEPVGRFEHWVAKLMEPIGETGEQAYFGDSAPTVRLQVMEHFCAMASEHSVAVREQNKEIESEIERLLASPEAQRSATDYRLLAIYHGALDQPELARQAAADAINRFPDAPDALIAQGYAKLVLDKDPSGKAFLERALELAPSDAFTIRQILLEGAAVGGDAKEAQAAEDELIAQAKLEERIEFDLRRLSPADKFEAASVSPQERRAFQAALAAAPEVVSAHLVRRRNKVEPNRWHTLLLIQLTMAAQSKLQVGVPVVQKVADLLPPLDEPTLVILADSFRWRRTVKSLPEAKMK